MVDSNNCVLSESSLCYHGPSEFVGTTKEVDPHITGSSFITLGECPKYNYLPKGNKLCGYISPEGVYHQCNSCQHEEIVRSIIAKDRKLQEAYFYVELEFYNEKPYGMLQEEYFLMKKMNYIKISSFKDTPHDMMVLYYNELTSKQTEIVYPK